MKRLTHTPPIAARATGLSSVGLRLGAAWLSLMAGAIALMPQPASAISLTPDWIYAIDSFNDGYDYGSLGTVSRYELTGLAMAQAGNRILFALIGNLPRNGTPEVGATGGTVAYGDLLLNYNYTTQSLATASAASNLFGIRFSAGNDSGVPALGLYTNVSAKSVTGENIGFPTQNTYNAAVQAKGGTPSMGDIAANDAYLNPGGAILNVIATGTKVGDITDLTSAELAAFGLDFSPYGAFGSNLVGFSIDQSLLPKGDFLATIFEECGNDGVALKGSSAGIPEPTTMTGLVLAGGALTALRRRRHTSDRQ